MIKFMLNGFQRSGTTFMWKLMKRSNPEMIHLFEPFNRTILNVEKLFDKKIRFLGDKVWKDYSYLPYETLERLKEEMRGFKREIDTGSLGYFHPIKIEEVSSYLDVIHELDVPITLQVNVCSLILPEISERYKCNYAHVIRNPYDVWISFMKPLMNDGWRTIVRKYILMRTHGDHWSLNYVYNFLKQYEDSVPIVKDNDYVGKFITSWAYINYYALKKMNKKGVAFWIENLDEDALKKLEKHSGINFDLSTVNYDKRRLMHLDNQELKDKVKKEIDEKVEELGLQELIEYINGFKTIN